MTVDDQFADLTEALKVAEQNLDLAKRRHAKAAGDLAVAVCPHRVGDLIEIGGESYRGKTGIVKEVRMIPYIRGYEWQVEVQVLKANGEPSAHRTQIRENQQVTNVRPE